MAFHHVALAVRDLDATHRFYTEAMGFTLVKAVAGKTPSGGWSKHLFYDTGGQGMIAFWEIHDDAEVAKDWSPAISTGLGLPAWVNHVAFHCEDLDDLEARKQRWLEHGLDVFEVDHGFCSSVYVLDPSQILVEFCTTTRPFTAADRERALAVLTSPEPVFDPDPRTTLHRARR